MFTRLRLAALSAEFIGTAALVLVVLVLSQITPVSYFVATSLAVALVAVTATLGLVSGGHFNPAVTFGMWTARRIGTLRAISYVAVQMLAGLAAWQLYQYLTDKALPAQTVTFSTQIWLAEAVGAFILVLGVTVAAAKALDTLHWAVTAGAAYFTGIIIASTAAAGYLNPAIALGARSWNFAYVLGPLVGGLVAANLYYLLLAPRTAIIRKAPAVSRKKR